MSRYIAAGYFAFAFAFFKPKALLSHPKRVPYCIPAFFLAALLCPN